MCSKEWKDRAGQEERRGEREGEEGEGEVGQALLRDSPGHEGRRGVSRSSEGDGTA